MRIPKLFLKCWLIACCVSIGTLNLIQAQCVNNLPASTIVNGDFELPAGFIPNNSATVINQQVPGWSSSHGHAALGAPPRSAFMWSRWGGGEGMFNNFNFVAGQTYTINFQVRTNAMGFGATLQLEATTGLVPRNDGAPNILQVPVPTTSQVIWQNQAANFAPNVWTNVVVCFTPNANYNQLWVYPLLTNNTAPNQVDMIVDNIEVRNTGAPCPCAILDFTFNDDGDCLKQFNASAFINQGLAVTDWSWDFGDGTTSNLQNPSHQFGSGIYEVTLTMTATDPALNNTCTETICKTIGPLCCDDCDPGECCNVEIDYTVENCTEYTFFARSPNTQILSYIWGFEAIYGGVEGTDPTFNASIERNDVVTLCMIYTGINICNPTDTCHDTICIDIQNIDFNFTSCYHTVELGECDGGLNLNNAAPDCAPCDNLPNPTVSPWSHINSGLPVGNSVTQPGRYEKTVISEDGCTQCRTRIEVIEGEAEFFTCEAEIEVPCFVSYPLSNVPLDCEVCAIPGLTLGDWIDPDGNVNPGYVGMPFDKEGVYSRKTYTPDGCVFCIVEINVKIKAPSPQFTFLGYGEDCPCRNYSFNELQALYNSLNGGLCSGSVSHFDIAAMPPPPYLGINIVVPPGGSYTMCMPNNYRIRANDDKCCEIIVTPYCFSGREDVAEEDAIDPFEISNGESLKLYPNPASNEVQIQFAQPIADRGVLTITSATGQVVKRIELIGQPGQLTIPVSTSEWAAGIYLVRLEHGGNVEEQKLLIQR